MPDLEATAWILAAGLATGLGGLFLLAGGLALESSAASDALLGFTAGVMLAATVFSLLVPALETGGVAEVAAGVLLGSLALVAADALIPHVHAGFEERGHPASQEIDPPRKRAMMLLSALTIHNVPEGMAVGVAFAAGGPELGVPVALAIGVQNIPEGFVAGAPLIEVGYSRRRAAATAAGTGLVEPPAAFAAYALAELAGSALAGALAFAAGAMLYVIVDELIPEAHARGRHRMATGGLVVGFVLMMTLDNALG